MSIPSENSDASIAAELGQRLSRYRLEANETQGDLARRAGVSTRTIARLEQGEPGSTVNLIRVMRALGLVERFDELVPPPLPSPLARIKAEGKERKRASR